MKVLVIVDVQNDFTPGGSLEVEEGDKIVPLINGIQGEFDLVVATQDWHPPEHSSFAVNHEGREEFDQIKLNGNDQTLWPVHCVQGTEGAEFHPELNTLPIEAIFRKGMNVDIDSYSGFYDNNHEKSTGLAGYLKEKNVEELHFCGLAADICVYFTIKDAVKEGFHAVLIEDCTQALDEKAFAEAKEDMDSLGVEFTTSDQL